MSASEETGVEQRGAADGGDGRPLDFQHQIRERRLAKLDALRERGVEPYPVRFDRDCTAAELHGQYRDLAPGVDTGRAVRLAGRLLAERRHGGLDFGDLHDETGVIQLMISRDHVGDQAMRDFSELDLGDWIGASGTVATSEHGELSIRVDSFELLSKSLRALPSVHDGITDPEARYRQRYLDLTLNESTRRTFAIRSAVIASTRRVLTERGFTEVETPVLLGQAGGAAARPFITHHNALDIDMTLRIALELPLKRLIVGGMDRVFEIGRVFRNEGLDTRHNPEFTLLEAYQAFGDYHDMMELTEAIVATAAMEAIGTTVVTIAGREVDLKPPWRRVTMAELIRENVGVEMHPSMPVEEARKIAEQLGIEWLKSWGSGKLMNEVYDESSEHKLIEPTFVIDHPREVSPLARAHRDDPALTERFELVVAGRELANAYSELNDPVDQAARFQAEARLKAGGDDETEPVDEDYVEALEYGLPPTGGLGIGIDRLVMLIAGEDAIRDVILFPTLRPERHGDADSPRPRWRVTGRRPRPSSARAWCRSRAWCRGRGRCRSRGRRRSRRRRRGRGRGRGRRRGRERPARARDTSPHQAPARVTPAGLGERDRGDPLGAADGHPAALLAGHLQLCLAVDALGRPDGVGGDRARVDRRGPRSEPRQAPGVDDRGGALRRGRSGQPAPRSRSAGGVAVSRDADRADLVQT